MPSAKTTSATPSWRVRAPSPPTSSSLTNNPPAVGRWQQRKDLNWYAKADGDSDGRTEAEKLAEEKRKLKEAEEDAMLRAMGLPVPERASTNANLTPLGEKVQEADVEKALEEKVKEGSAEAEGKRREKKGRERRHRDDDGERRKRRHRSRSREGERRDKRRERSRSKEKPRRRSRDYEHRRRDDRNERRRDRRSSERSPDRERERHRRRRSRSPYERSDRRRD
jgi:hypothetical protein